MARAAGLPRAELGDVGFDGRRLERIDRWLRRLVTSRRFPGATVAIIRDGHVAYACSAGFADVERKVRMSHRTLVRVKSMTKPLTSVAGLTLFEQGQFQLDDPVRSVLPYFRDLRVVVGGGYGKLTTEPSQRDMSIRDLLTHTAGLTYGFLHQTPVDEMYRQAGVDFQLDSPIRNGPPTHSLEEMVKLAATMPLVAHPGERWNYSIATDVLGHIISVISELELPKFMEQAIFAPLGMNDTTFTVPADQIGRLAAHYGYDDDGLTLLEDPRRSPFTTVPTLHSGGGGVVSTIGDYLRFCQMLLNDGALNGTQVLCRKTVELMRTDQLGADIHECGTPMLGTTFPGLGFGLGLSVMRDLGRAQIIGSPGEVGWTGSASTAFWVDPREKLAVVFLTQVTPDWIFPLRRELRVLTYQALVN